MTDDEGPRFELPDRGTLLVIGVFVLVSFGLLALLVPGLDLKAPPPASGGPIQATQAGTVIFGAVSDGACGVGDSATQFESGAPVWWTARFAYALELDAVAVIVFSRDGHEISRVTVASTQRGGTWDTACSDKPNEMTTVGRYRIEIRDVSDSVTYAVGEYQVA